MKISSGLVVTIVVTILFNQNEAKAQKNVTYQDLIWYGYFLTLQISDKWYFQNEVQERQFINPTAQHLFFVRGHLHRYLGNSGWETSAGFCYALQDPNDPNAAVRLTVPELRPHIEIAHKQKLKHLIIDHRYRTDIRFYHNVNQEKSELADGYSFGNFRFRYLFQATVPVFEISDKKFLRIKINDEVHLNAGSNIVKNVFDQNRLYAGLSIDLTPNLIFDCGYLNCFQQVSSGDFYNRDILSFSAFHRIDLRKKTK